MEFEYRGRDYPKEYRCYHHMKSRCLNPNNKDYHNYGFKGITIQPSFLLPKGEGFNNFMKCIGPKPQDKKSVDRINAWGNYEEGNIRWANDKEQANNKTNNHIITYKDKTQTLTQWCEELNLSFKKVSARLLKLKLTIEEAFSQENYNGKGSNATKSNVTKEQVKEIFLSTEEFEVISKKYGLSLASISRIKNRKRYKEETKDLGDPGRSLNPMNPSKNKKSLH